MRKFLLPLYLLLLAFSTYAQKKKIEFGFQGGVNLNSVYGNAVAKAELDNTIGLSLGVHTKLAFCDHIGVRVQLSYEQFGWAYKDLYFEDSVGGLSKGDVAFKLNYLHLPIMAECSFGKTIKFLISAGGFAGILLSNRIVVNKAASAFSQQPVNYSYSSDSRSKVNAGLAAGLGVQIPLASKVALGVNVRNYIGLTNINKVPSGYNSSIKTMTFSLLSSLTFQL